VCNWIGTVNPLLHLVHLAIRERVQDEGAFLRWDCPRCESIRNFHLINSRTHLSFLGLEFETSKTLLDLRCTDCKYDVRVYPSERNLLDNAKELTARLMRSELNYQVYMVELQALDAKFVKDIIALTQNWKCSKCGEENPSSFESCWSCKSKEGGSTEVNDDAKPFPSVPRGGNPWET
jgi:hypothetical protein